MSLEQPFVVRAYTGSEAEARSLVEFLNGHGSYADYVRASSSEKSRWKVVCPTKDMASVSGFIKESHVKVKSVEFWDPAQPWTDGFKEVT